MAVFVLFSSGQPVLSADFQTIKLLKSDFNRLKSFSFNLPEIEMPEELSQLPQTVLNALSQKVESVKINIKESVNMAVNGGVRVWRTLSLSRGEREYEINRQGTVSNKEPIVAPPVEAVEEETMETEELRQEIAKLQTEIERLKKEGLPAKEIVKEVQKITQIEPVKEIIKEVIKVDQEPLTEIRAQIQALEKDLAKKYSNLETRYAQLETRASQALYYPQISYMTPSLPYQNVQTGNVSLSAGNLLEFTGNSIRISGDTRVLGSLSVGAATLTIDSSGNLSTSGNIATTGTITVKEVHITEKIIAEQSFSIRSSGLGAYDVTLANTENLTAGRTLTIKLNDANRTIDMAGNLTLAGAFTTTGGAVSLGADAGGATLTIGAGGTLGSAAYTTSTAYEASGVVATHAALTATHGVSGAIVGTTDIQTLTNKTLTSPTIQGTVLAGTGLTMPAFTAGGNIAGGSGFTISTSAGDLILSPTGNVGIGMTGPGGKLDVLGTSSSVPQLRLTYDADTYGQFYLDATGDLSVELTDGAAGDDIRIVNENLWVCTGGTLGTPACPGATLTGTGNLVVASEIEASTLTLSGDITLTAGGTIQSTGNANITINAGSGTVVIGDGTGKLDAGVVDPIYTINGKAYATYLPGMTGMKEETTGLIQLKYDNEQSVYTAVIDFDELEEGSDLWLFSRIIVKDMNLISVLLTPNAPAKTWYKKDSSQRQIIFYSDAATEVSYRLSAPRFDYRDWPNLRKDQTIKGYIVP